MIRSAQQTAKDKNREEAVNRAIKILQESEAKRRDRSDNVMVFALLVHDILEKG